MRPPTTRFSPFPSRLAKRASTAGLLCMTEVARAHEGHGLLGSHWHATDVLGFVGVAMAVGVAIWWTRGGK